jgi:hypothetical protein
MTQVAPTPAPTPPSQFDPTGVQYAWDSVSLGLFKTCPRKYFLTMIENWQARTPSHHLTFGIIYHSAIEGYLKVMAQPSELSREEQHNEAVHKAIKFAMIASASYAPPPNDNNKTRVNLLRTLVWYFDHFGLSDPCTPVILQNGKAAVELSFRFQVDYDQVLCGHLDAIVQYGDHRYVLDHKTTKYTVTGASAQYFFEKFNPDNQMTLYALGAAVAFHTPVKGIIIDAAQIGVSFSAFQRGFTYRNEPQLQEFLENFYTYRRTAEVYHRTGVWPMNETACDNYGGCAFRGICSKSPLVRDRFLRTDFTQDQPRWNPLIPR